jgi:secreted trypsin-like serine protease
LRPAILGATLVLAGLPACEAPSLDLVEQPIINGSAAPGDVGVVGLARRVISCGPDQAAIDCTGTLVAPRVVITAAHCLAFDPPNVYEIFFGASYADGGVVIPVIGGRADPDYDPDTHANDLAGLILASDAPSPPIPLRTTPLPDLTGTSVRMVGYGVTSVTAAELGVKMSGIAMVTEVAADQLRMAPSPSMSCYGDSGGPVLADTGNGEELVGVTSYGDAACATLGVATRVDDHVATFIQPILDEAAAPVQRRPFDPGEALCSGSCASDADCPSETVCFGAEPRRCVYRGLQPGQFGATCTSGSSEICISMPDGTCRTYTSCDSPPAGGGCCSIDHDDGTIAPGVLLALLAWRRRRR